MIADNKLIPGDWFVELAIYFESPAFSIFDYDSFSNWKKSLDYNVDNII